MVLLGLIVLTDNSSSINHILIIVIVVSKKRSSDLPSGDKVSGFSSKPGNILPTNAQKPPKLTSHVGFGVY